ncbi:MAG: glycosyltransferase family 4 protein [Cyanobacteriota bacterium]|nr:glycosyltransferase family 4 protein [Cyanobacteriota bacterium]
MTKVALLFANFGPYHLSRFKAFQDYCQQRGWQAVGIELTRSGIAYDWRTQLDNFSSSIVSVLGEQTLNAVRFDRLIRQLYAVLARENPDAIAIAGYFRPALLAALLWCRWHGKAAILLSDSKQDDAPRQWWKETVKAGILKGFQAALVGGKPHKRYAIDLGIPPEGVFCDYDTIDNATFHPNAIRHLPSPLPRPYFLAVNRFIPKKNLFRLLDAYALYHQSASGEPWDLVLCGDGELRNEIEKRIDELGLASAVRLPGFLQQSQMLPYYAHAGCFIHASTQEQWGLVVNEAMAAGLPVLVSRCCGCYEDLIVDGATGFGFDPENTEELARLMLEVASETFDRAKIGRAALDRIQHFSPDAFARGLSQAVCYGLGALTGRRGET